MNVTEYTYLLNNPEAFNNRQIIALEKILDDFPYFQSARSLQLKNLYKQGSFKYNSELKKTATFTTDRSILFDLITSENFISINKEPLEEAKTLHTTLAENNTLIIENDVKPEINKLEKSIISSIKKANQDLQEKTTPEVAKNLTTEEKLEIGKPLIFNNSETHSFQEWLQLAKIKPIIREENQISENNLSSKLEIIDKFIETNPKISPAKKDTLTPVITIKTEDNSYLMTETLAKVYLEQKKYSKAIQAYEILILKYPEKITFFADRISDIKMLQQNNNNS
ncbi:tetratricopeptide repeat protein [Flavobacterium psychrophilum]|uniref:tetratricopeptide repeat protein n=1 Tax=Flavobacterium psychrophilum TaxID=96345 RepID=UPI00106A2CC1|nr:tetratricopeptide repeat protein [Flavobacterium psychrophilum]